AISAPIWTGDPVYRPEVIKFDDDGNLWVGTVFGGLFNGPTAFYNQVAGERTYTSAWPSASTAWSGGDGTVTSDGAQPVTPSASDTNTAVGASPGGMVWDADNSVMYLVEGAGVLALRRTGSSGAYTYSLLGKVTTQFDDAAGTNHPTRPVLDTTNGMLWM